MDEPSPPMTSLIHVVPVIKGAVICATETVSPDSKPYTVYRIQVETSVSMYNILRRYSEFLEFDLNLHSAYPLSRLPFPPKKTFGKMNNEFIVQRKDHLQQFMNALFTHPTLKQLPSDPLVVTFFTQSAIDIAHFDAEASYGPRPHVLPTNDQVVRYIISTLPFWSNLLDYQALISLTETCNYLWNTVSYYSDVWKKHYWEQHSVLHYGLDASLVKSCICSVELTNYLNERSKGLKRENTLPNLAALIQQQTSSATSSPASGAINIGRRTDTVITRSSLLSTPPLTSVEAMEYSRHVFIQLLHAHHYLRTSPESHTDPKNCRCYAPKFKGTIVGMPNITDTFLKSFNTEFTSSTATTNTTTPTNTSTTASTDSLASDIGDLSLSVDGVSTPLEPLAPTEIISHIVSNQRLLCVATTDSSNVGMEERRHNLSMSHFVLIVFSLVNVASFESVNGWVEEVRLMCPESPIILVGLQRDLRETSGNNESVSYQQGLDVSKRIPQCVGYIESPSASDGVGGWRRSLLSELASHICTHFRSVINQPTKKNKYEIKISFLSKIFPKYNEEMIFKGLSSYEGDVEKTIELLALDYATYVGNNDAGLNIDRSNRSRAHYRSQSNDHRGDSARNSWLSPSSQSSSSWNLRQSWNAEISGMDKDKRDQLIDVYLGTKDDSRPNSPPNNNITNNNSASSTTTTTTTTTTSSNNHNNNQQRINANNAIKISEQQISNLVEKLKKSSVDSFIKGFLKKKNLSQDQQAEMVLSFLREMRTQLQSSQLFVNLPNQEEDLTGPPLNEIENYLYQNIYKSVFSTQESLEKDIVLSEHMSKLVFVEPQHLEIRESHWNKDLWIAAEKELHSVNDLYSPSQKLEFLLSNSDSPGGADDFLPHLIYVVIHANVPNLFSNFEFTSKFCNSELLKMERYYYFTTFGIAVTFIENVDGKHLKIDIEEYEAYMSGKKRYVPKKEEDESISAEEYNREAAEKEAAAAINELSRAKIMQKLGIDSTQIDSVISSPKKTSHEDLYYERSESIHIGENSNSKGDPFKIDDGPLLPISWSQPLSETNKRSSVKLSHTPSPPDLKNINVEEHPLSNKKKNKSATSTPNNQQQPPTSPQPVVLPPSITINPSTPPAPPIVTEQPPTEGSISNDLFDQFSKESTPLESPLSPPTTTITEEVEEEEGSMQ
eukprot:gene9810-11459_t